MSSTRAAVRSSSRSRAPRACSRRSTPTRTSSSSAISITCASRASGSCRARRPARGKSPPPFRKEIYTHSGELVGQSRHLRDRRGRQQQRRVGDLCVRRRVHGPDDRLGLRGLGQRLVLPALRVTAASTTRTRTPTEWAPGTTRTRGRTDAATRRMVRTAALGWVRRTTRAREPTRAVPRPTARTVRARPVRRTTRAPAPTRRRARARTSTATGARAPCSAATTGRRRRTQNYQTGRSTARQHEPAAVPVPSRPAGPRGRTTVGRTAGGDVYAGHDGNVYRKNDGGGWEQNNGSGGWNSVERSGDRATTQTRDLDSDSRARAQGNERTANRSSWESSGGSRSGASSYGGSRSYGSSGGGGRSRSGGGGRRR